MTAEVNWPDLRFKEWLVSGEHGRDGIALLRLVNQILVAEGRRPLCVYCGTETAMAPTSADDGRERIPRSGRACRGPTAS